MSVDPYDPNMNHNKLSEENNRKQNRVNICKSILCVIFIALILSIVLPVIISDVIYLITNYLHIIPNLENLPMGIFTVDEDDYITARSIITYKGHLFPQLKDNDSLINKLMKQSFLDIGSGANHIYKESLLYKLIHKKAKWAKGIDICCSKLKNSPHFINRTLYDTGLDENSINVATCQYVLYSHIKTIEDLKKAFKEIHRILKKGGEIRIYPIYYGNYFLGDESFKRHLQRKFKITIIDPVYSVDTNKRLYIKGKLVLKPDVKIMEWIRHNILDVKTVIFTKK